jgi:hypothetical protein
MADETGAATAAASSGGSFWGDLGSGLSVISAGASLLSAFYSSSAAAEAAGAKRDALKREKRFNINLMKFEREERGWIDMMSAWASGTTAGIGTSTYGAMMSNQNVLQREIEFQTEKYDTEIKNLNKQSKQRFLGIF